MANIEIYTTPFCPFCVRAKHLLKSKGVDFKEIDVMMSASKRRKMSEMAGGATSVPQVFVDGEHIGDCDGIYAMDARGQLDPVIGVVK